MSTGDLVLCIPIVAIIMGVGSEIFNKWLKHNQEMARIRSSARTQGDQSIQSQFEILQNEIAQLRDTTTKYDMSVESALQELRRRVATLESGRNGTGYRPVAPESEQHVSVSPRIIE